jgi:hypothetical protein
MEWWIHNQCGGFLIMNLTSSNNPFKTKPLDKCEEGLTGLLKPGISSHIIGGITYVVFVYSGEKVIYKKFL